MHSRGGLRLVAAWAAPLLTGTAAAMVLAPFSPTAKNLTLAGLFLAIFLISIQHLRRELAFRRFQTTMQKGLGEIEGGNLALRFRSAPSGAIFDGIVSGVNTLASLLESGKAEAIRSESMRRRLLSDISHDIRTPLTSVIGYIDALRDDIATSDTEREQYLAIVADKAHALKRMIDDIFSLAKLDADEIPMHPERFDACEAIRSLCIEFLPVLKAREIALEADIPEAACPLFMDRLSLERIVRNLVQNAIDHGEENHWIRVRVRQDASGDIRISVADRGPGISAEDLSRVFTRLFSRDASRSGARGGSGLGLAIVEALVRKNGGAIAAASAADTETVFEALFPARHTDVRKM